MCGSLWLIPKYNLVLWWAWGWVEGLRDFVPLPAVVYRCRFCSRWLFAPVNVDSLSWEEGRGFSRGDRGLKTSHSGLRASVLEM